jgi:xanthine dehydrogenase accessory factor
MKKPYLSLLDLQLTGQPMVLATVTKTTGSTPQKPGCSALFSAAGLVWGTVGGGIVEGKIQQTALQSLSTGESGYYRFNLNREAKNGEDAICGGIIDILIDATPNISVFSELKQSLEQRIPGVLVTTIKSVSGNNSIERSWFTSAGKTPDVNLAKEIKKLLLSNDPDQYSEYKQSNPELTIFLEPIFPLPKLIIVGAGHIGKSLSHLGKMLDFEVTVIDDRSEYANKANLPDADHIIVGDIGEVMGNMDLNPDTYVVIVTRGHKDDARALRECIGGQAAYVGMIGSRNKVAVMREEFMRKGWVEPREWKDIHAPIGLDIHSKSVDEIAISIAAQLIQVKNAKIPVHV